MVESEWTALSLFSGLNLGQVPGGGDRICGERERVRECWLQLTDWNEGLAGLFFSVLAQGKAKKKTKELGACAWPSLQKLWREDRTFLFFFGSERRAGSRRR